MGTIFIRCLAAFITLAVTLVMLVNYGVVDREDFLYWFEKIFNVTFFLVIVISIILLNMAAWGLL